MRGFVMPRADAEKRTLWGGGVLARRVCEGTFETELRELWNVLKVGWESLREYPPR
jgi:hypothetical protein